MAWAKLLHDQLKAEGVEAWYDTQIGAGQDWRVATANALEASQIFVLLFTASAALSKDIAKELAAATLENKLIIPVRLENIAPKGAFLYELASRTGSTPSRTPRRNWNWPRRWRNWCGRAPVMRAKVLARAAWPAPTRAAGAQRKPFPPLSLPARRLSWP